MRLESLCLTKSTREKSKKYNKKYIKMIKNYHVLCVSFIIKNNYYKEIIRVSVINLNWYNKGKKI